MGMHANEVSAVARAGRGLSVRVRAKKLLLEHAGIAAPPVEARDDTQPAERPDAVDSAVYAGRDARASRAIRPKEYRAETFASVRHAIRALVSFNADGAPIGSIGDIRRAAEGSAPVQSTPKPSVGHLIAESVHVVRSALDSAFASPIPPLDTRRGKEAFLVWMHADKPPSFVAREFGLSIPQARRFLLTAHERVYELLRKADAVPVDRTVGRSEMAEHDLNGWKEIAAFLRVERRTAMRWAAEEGMPVTYFRRSVSASADDLNAWKSRMAELDPRNAVR